LLRDAASLIHLTLLQPLPVTDIEAGLADGSFCIRTYGKNSIVHFVGEKCLRLEIIVEGQVVVERIDETGNLMAVADFCADEILGGNLLFSRKPNYPLTITARQPSTVLEISRDRLFQLFTTNPEFLRSFLAFISDHATLLSDRISRYVNRTIREIVTSYLEHESKRQQSKVIRMEISKKALADKIGVRRTSLSRELAKMRAEGLIRFDQDTIEMINLKPD